MRNRCAPSAARTAISRRRVSPRASIRLATLAQAISSTRLTAPSRIEQHRTRVAEAILAQRADDDAEVALIVLVGILARRARDDAVHLGAMRPRPASAVHQPARTPRGSGRRDDCAAPRDRASAAARCRRSWPRQSRTGSTTPSRDDADDLAWARRRRNDVPTIDGSAPKRRRQKPSERIATGGAPAASSSARKARPELRRHAQHVEGICRDERGLHALGIAALPADVDVGRARSRPSSATGCAPRSPGTRDSIAPRPGCRPIGSTPRRGLRLGVRQRPQQHGVDDAEDRGVGADAERQRQDGDGDERRRCGACRGARSGCPAAAARRARAGQSRAARATFSSQTRSTPAPPGRVPSLRRGTCAPSRRRSRRGSRTAAAAAAGGTSARSSCQSRLGNELLRARHAERRFHARRLGRATSRPNGVSR